MSPYRVHWIAWVIAIVFVLAVIWGLTHPSPAGFERCDNPLYPRGCGR